MATSIVGARALPTSARATSAPVPATTTARQRERGRVGFFARFVAIGFWGTLASLIVGAAASAGVVILFMLPLLGLGYLVFCFIALTGDRNVE